MYQPHRCTGNKHYMACGWVTNCYRLQQFFIIEVYNYLAKSKWPNGNRPYSPVKYNSLPAIHNKEKYDPLNNGWSYCNLISYQIFIPCKAIYGIISCVSFHFKQSLLDIYSSIHNGIATHSQTIYTQHAQASGNRYAIPPFWRTISFTFHRRPVNSPHKWPVSWKMFPFDDVIMICKDLFRWFDNGCRSCIYGKDR